MLEQQIEQFHEDSKFVLGIARRLQKMDQESQLRRARALLDFLNKLVGDAPKPTATEQLESILGGGAPVVPLVDNGSEDGQPSDGSRAANTGKASS